VSVSQEDAGAGYIILIGLFVVGLVIGFLLGVIVS
jgi:hypothetical protein